MADFVRSASYFKMAAPDKAGEGARALSGLRDAGVNLLAFSGFPRNRRAQLDFVPADPMAFNAAAKQAKLKAASPVAVDDPDRLGSGQRRPVQTRHDGFLRLFRRLATHIHDDVRVFDL